MKNTGLQKAISIAGSQTALAKRLGKYPQLVQFWSSTQVPAKWVLKIEKETGVHRSEIRPDLYPKETA